MSRRLQIMLEPRVLRWARERARLDPEQLAQKMKVKPERVLEWERSGRISVAQVDRLAFYSRTPLGYLYLTEPLDDQLPIPDFRTKSDTVSPRPSPELLDTVYAMQRRQSWMRQETIMQGGESLSFVGAYNGEIDPCRAVCTLLSALQLEPNWASKELSWLSALNLLRERADRTGVLVVFNSVFENNTHRKLDRDEFQGFALADDYAPLVFVNGADLKASQMFTLAYELAHLLVGESGVSGFRTLQPPDDPTEQLCDRIAAEFLAPEEELRSYWPEARRTDSPYQAIARRFNVSSLIAARRALDLGLVDSNLYLDFYGSFRDITRREGHKGGPVGGNFWLVQKWRLSPRFAEAVARAAKEGRLLYQDAYSLTGLRGNTFEKLPEKMGVVL